MTLKIKSRSPKSNHFFASSLWCICASSVKFQPLVKEILCTQTFYFINKAPLGSLLSISNVVTLKIRSRSPKSNHFFPPYWWCICASLVKFQPLVKEIMCTQTFNALTRLTFLSIYSVVTLKIKSRSPKSNHFFAPSLWCICASSVKFQSLVKEILSTQTFYFISKDPLGSFLSIYSVVTLKIKSRSPKSKHFFAPFLWCICASSVYFQLKRYYAHKLFTSITRLLFEYL